MSTLSKIAEKIYDKIIELSAFNKSLERFRISFSDFDKAAAKFKELCDGYLSKYPRFVKTISEKAEFYLAHMKYPEELRKHILTTNAALCVNSMIEKARRKFRWILSVC